MEPTPAIRGAAAELAARGVRAGGFAAVLVKPEALHFTLAFLGEIPEARRGAVEGALAGAPNVPPFTAGVAGLGAFPGPERARVLWAGVRDGAAELTALAGGVRAALRALGGTAVDSETRPFTPHLTLCRFRAPAALKSLELFAGLTDTVMGRCPIQEFVLFRSILTSGGARHERLRAFPLAE